MNRITPFFFAAIALLVGCVSDEAIESLADSQQFPGLGIKVGDYCGAGGKDWEQLLIDCTSAQRIGYLTQGAGAPSDEALEDVCITRYEGEYRSVCGGSATALPGSACSVKWARGERGSFICQGQVTVCEPRPDKCTFEDGVSNCSPCSGPSDSCAEGFSCDMLISTREQWGCVPLVRGLYHFDDVPHVTEEELSSWERLRRLLESPRNTEVKSCDELLAEAGN